MPSRAPPASAPEPPDPSLTDRHGIQALARGLQARARTANHRFALVLSGGPDWTAAAAAAAARALGQPSSGRPAIWLTDRDLSAPRTGTSTPVPRRVLPLRAATGLVGEETALLVYDAWSGFDPDGFGAATGTLRGGGLLLLLTPPLSIWPDVTDPQAERIAVWPHRAETVSGRFLTRLARILASHPGAILVTEGHPMPESAPAPSAPPATGPEAPASDPR